MCGICGIFGEADGQTLAAMMETIRHRGPDDEGTYLDSGIALGHLRLSIIDLSPAGRQPMKNEDGTVWVAYNGEIYGYKKLRQELEAQGHRFSSDTDTEVLVHLWEQNGPKMLSRISGMFSFAIYDAEKKVLFAARDRLGKKPLYYLVDGQTLVFASEIKALLKYPGIDAKVSPEGLNAYFTHQYVPAPYTMFEGIKKLPPGHSLSFGEEGLAIERYWDIDLGASSSGDHASAVLDLLTSSVTERLVSDVPLGVYLSGGLDSSAVAALASRDYGKPLKTISVGFDYAEFDESPYARQVADHIGADHTEIRIGPDIFERFADIVWHLDEPIADNAVIPTFAMAERAKEHATVYLTGDGADELFGGYTKYRWARRREALAATAFWPLLAMTASIGPIGDLLDGLASSHDVRGVIASRGDSEATYHRSSRVLTEGEKEEVIIESHFDANPWEETVVPHVEAADSTSADFVNRMMYLDIKTWLAEDFLMKVDKCSMAHAVETRTPFLDYRLVQYAFTIPSSEKVSLHGTRKAILRKAVAGLLPADIVSRDKKGFEIPADLWFKEELSTRIDSLPKDLEAIGLFNVQKTMGLLDHYLKSGKKDKRYEVGRRLWNLLYGFQVWHGIYMGGKR